MFVSLPRPLRFVLICALALVGIAFATAASTLAGLLFGLDLSGGFGAGMAAALFVQQLVLFGLGLALAPSKAPRTVPVDRLPAALFGVACGLTGSAIGMFLAVLQTQLFGVEVEEQLWIVEALGRGDLWSVALIALVVIAAPLGEESYFRRFFFPTLSGPVGSLVALLISAALFALIHFNPTGLALYFVLGCTLGVAYRVTGRLTAAVAGHMAHNALTVGLFFLGKFLGA